MKNQSANVDAIWAKVLEITKKDEIQPDEKTFTQICELWGMSKGKTRKVLENLIGLGIVSKRNLGNTKRIAYKIDEEKLEAHLKGLQDNMTKQPPRSEED